MTENVKKYGTKENDIIEDQFNKHILCGIGFCLGNLNKYIKRFISTSEKANDKEDIIKMHDYINRCEEKVIKQSNFDYLRGLINKELYSTALVVSDELESVLIDYYVFKHKNK